MSDTSSTITSTEQKKAQEILQLNHSLPFATFDALAKANTMPVCLVGAPGTGKTKTIETYAKSIGYRLETIIASRLEPTELGGYPTRAHYTNSQGEEKVRTEYAPQEWQIRVMEHPNTVLFFDEFSNTPAGVQASLLSFIQDRQFPNGDKLPKETRIILAMNAIEDSADGVELAPPMSNRIAFISWKLDNNAWLSGFINKWGADMSDNEKTWRSIIASSLEENRDLILTKRDEYGGEEIAAYGVNTHDENDVTVYRYAYATPRSWDNLASVLGSQVSAQDPQDEVVSSLSRSIVGGRAATKLSLYISENWESVIELYNNLDFMSADDIRELATRPSEFNILLNYMKQNSSEHPDQWNRVYNALTRFIDEASTHAIIAPFMSRFIDVEKGPASTDAERLQALMKLTTHFSKAVRLHG
ncbi:MAG: AAA family ATPase [Actinomycetaceae bacterium]|nr:AAA family ATPase [Actinomycetaceae bacterium]